MTRAAAGEDFDAAEWATFVEGDVDRLRKLGVRLRAVAAALDGRASARLDEACADAVAEVDPAGRQVRRADSATVDARVRGTAAALSAAITLCSSTEMPTTAPTNHRRPPVDRFRARCTLRA